MIHPIEISHYCSACGNELEAEIKMDKPYNEARIDIAPCKICEKHRTSISVPVMPPAKVERHPKVRLGAMQDISPKKRGCPKNNVVGALAAAIPPPVVAPKRRGRPPKVKTE